MTQHQLILECLSDHLWHLASEVHEAMHGWKGASRISELKSRNIDIDGRKAQDRVQWEYRLITPVDQIDFKNCHLKVQPSGVPLPKGMPERGTPIPRYLEASSGYSQAKAGLKAGEGLFPNSSKLLTNTESQLILLLTI